VLWAIRENAEAWTGTKYGLRHCKMRPPCNVHIDGVRAMRSCGRLLCECRAANKITTR